MLTLITSTSAKPLNVDDYYIRQLSSGMDEVKFSISIFDPIYQELQEETTIREESAGNQPCRYIIKAIDGGSTDANVVCNIDLDEWKTTLTVGYKSDSAAVADIVNAVKPQGWTVTDNSGFTFKRTVELEAATPLDVLEQCRSTFGVTFRFDNINRVVTIINTAAYQPLGAFATRDLNLKENNYKGKSSSFATRLYAQGKDGLTFASINGGKPYVDDNTYSDKVICAWWKDERYTVPENLYADAKAKLTLMAVPERSYDCSVYDLAKTDPDRYSYLDFSLFAVVGLIDQTRANTIIYHQIVELWIYPYYPHKNKVVLSTSPGKIQSQLKNITNAVTNPLSEWNQVQSAAQAGAIKNATDEITGQNGGYLMIGLNDAGQPYELLIMDAPDKTAAKNLWRWNLGGLGHSSNGYNGTYGTAITQDGKIVADFIQTGALNSEEVTVGGFTLSTKSLHNGMTDFDDTAHNGVYIGTDGIALGGGKFKVDADGNLYATSGTFTGNVYAKNIQAGGDAGYISGYQIGTGTVTGGNIGTYTISGGYGGNVGGGTLTTTNTNTGINTSLAYADQAGNAFNNNAQVTYMKAAILEASSMFFFQGQQCRWSTITDKNGVNFYAICRDSGT